MMACLKVLFGQLDALDQGSSNLSLEEQSAARLTYLWFSNDLEDSD